MNKKSKKIVKTSKKELKNRETVKLLHKHDSSTCIHSIPLRNECPKEELSKEELAKITEKFSALKLFTPLGCSSIKKITPLKKLPLYGCGGEGDEEMSEKESETIKNSIIRENKEELPRADPNFMQKIANEATILNEEMFEKSLCNCLEEKAQQEIISKKQKELTDIRGKQPFNQFLTTKEYKLAKKEFYYDIVHQIVSMRLQVIEKIKAKYGEDIAKTIIFRIRKDIADIWMNDEGYGVEIEEKNKELKEAHVKLEEIKANQSNVLSELPKVTGYDLLENSHQIKTEYPEDCFSSNPLEINCDEEIVSNIEEIDIVDEIGEIINKGWMKDRIRVHKKNS